MSGNITKKLPIVEELEKLFTQVNTKVFGGELKQPTITLQLDKKVVFRFFGDSYTLAIGSKFADVPLPTMFKVFVHEMVHIKNDLAQEIDCTSNQYHNKHFLSAALEAGLFVGRHKTQGWGATGFTIEQVKSESVKSPSPAALARRLKCFEEIEAKFDKNVFVQSKKSIRKLLNDNGPRKVCFLKYVCKCPSPHNSIRSGRRPDGPNALNIRCLDCKSLFVCEEE